MTRLVELEGTGPRKLDPDDIDDEKGDIAVCRCGLSDSFPFCDGSHRRTEGEEEGTTYVRKRRSESRRPGRYERRGVEFGRGLEPERELGLRYGLERGVVAVQVRSPR